MNRTEIELKPGFRRSGLGSIKGDKTRQVVTMNPNKASPGEKLYIDIPKLKQDRCLVPGSLHLLFDLKVSNTKSHFLNNLSELLQKQLQITLSGETGYDNTEESLYSVHKDLYLSKSQRENMIEYGIGSENLRKLISKDDSGATSGDATKVSEKLMFDIYGTKQKICLDRIIRDHGLYAPFQMNNNFKYIITLPQASKIMVAQSGETLGNYSLENLELEYETIENQDIADVITSLYRTGRSLSYEHITLMKTVLWTASSTLINESINIPCKSVKAIVLLFTNTTRKDREEFLYPNITSVKLTIEGVPNQVYSQGIPKSRLYDEAKRLFGSKNGMDQFMTLEKFYKDKFALVIDLRLNEEVNRTGHGKKIVNTQNGILLEIKKTTHRGDIQIQNIRGL